MSKPLGTEGPEPVAETQATRGVSRTISHQRPSRRGPEPVSFHPPSCTGRACPIEALFVQTPPMAPSKHPDHKAGFPMGLWAQAASVGICPLASTSPLLLPPLSPHRCCTRAALSLHGPPLLPRGPRLLLPLPPPVSWPRGPSSSRGPAPQHPARSSSWPCTTHFSSWDRTALQGMGQGVTPSSPGTASVATSKCGRVRATGGDLAAGARGHTGWVPAQASVVLAGVAVAEAVASSTDAPTVPVTHTLTVRKRSLSQAAKWGSISKVVEPGVNLRGLARATSPRRNTSRLQQDMGPSSLLRPRPSVPSPLSQLQSRVKGRPSFPRNQARGDPQARKWGGGPNRNGSPGASGLPWVLPTIPSLCPPKTPCCPSVLMP